MDNRNIKVGLHAPGQLTAERVAIRGGGPGKKRPGHRESGAGQQCAVWGGANARGCRPSLVTLMRLSVRPMGWLDTRRESNQRSICSDTRSWAFAAITTVLESIAKDQQLTAETWRRLNKDCQKARFDEPA